MYLILYKTTQDFDTIPLFFALRSLKCHYIMEYVVILQKKLAADFSCLIS